ncbi:hypothetical protein THASP1DRAFT_17742 [Thamnocephalis sphaerospora]|uniref:G-patch domain-containing protein n=1 Tax=Thamnocephalis sphaerospora TaxID=78915 RepID=A0A4P9XM43_9FUNG|nr:hypothetical protein THASP1DRAFT_17742 [Thamnocephalis sphaerospora]|eukprot:RKP06973.1 hypothetical protein THASP1DRAFT_17742 [Thamnocephalis sphaerospora]
MLPSTEERYGSFAAKQLARFGWEEGKGLGKSGDGITRAVSIARKDDQKGLGSGSDAWGFAWWDHIYNKSSTAIKIEKEGEEIKVASSSKSNLTRNRMGIISTERPKTTAKKEKKKAKKEKKKAKKEKKSKKAHKSKKRVALCRTRSASDDDTHASSDDEDESSAESGSESEAENDGRDYSIRVTDTELLAACEGRTARKGARAEQPAKLARVDMLLTAAQTTANTLATPVTAGDSAGTGTKRERSTDGDSQDASKKSKKAKKSKKSRKEKKESSKKKKGSKGKKKRCKEADA